MKLVWALIASILLCGLLNAQITEKWWEELPRPSWKRFEKITQRQSWFEVYKIQPGLFAIYEPGQYEEVISYLIVGTKKSILFDSGLGIGDMKKLVAELSPAEPVVINSHSHYDHVGGNFQFKEIYAADSEFSQLNSKGSPHEEVKEFVSKGWIWKETPKDFDSKNYSIKPYKITRALQNGDRIDLGDRVIEVIRTPGHSPDSICLLDRKNRLLFVGDTFIPGPLYAHIPDSNFKQYLESAALLHKLQSEVDSLLPAHNETLLPPSYLNAMHQAFLRIQDGTARYKDQDSIREYLFDGFSVLVKKPK
jgi:glyoxylase-like metal-dependent hydrolase (beta-lactamase superfamily II)